MFWRSPVAILCKQGGKYCRRATTNDNSYRGLGQAELVFWCVCWSPGVSSLDCTAQTPELCRSHKGCRQVGTQGLVEGAHKSYFCLRSSSRFEPHGSHLAALCNHTCVGIHVDGLNYSIDHDLFWNRPVTAQNCGPSAGRLTQPPGQSTYKQNINISTGFL